MNMLSSKYLKYSLFVLLTLLLPTAVRAAESVIRVGGIEYTWSSGDGAYIVTGYDAEAGITELHIPNIINDGSDNYDVVAIAVEAFNNNDYIEQVVIDSGITTIGEWAFADCDKLRLVRMADGGVTNIGAHAFSRCYNLQNVVLPEGLKVIDDNAFEFCRSLTKMVIPLTVTDIRFEAFRECTGVTDVYFRMTTATQLSGFDWWDGQYRDEPSTAGGMDFNQSKYRNPDSYTRIHVPNGTLAIYQQSGKLEAWLTSIEEDTAYPLWWIVNYGTVGETYTVADDLTGIYRDIAGDLHAKDDQHWLTPDVAQDGEVDYMPTTGLLRNRGNVYDQSNWVALRNVTDAADYVDFTITGGTITGKLVDKLNPLIEVTSTPVKGTRSSYTPNTYIAASVMTRTQKGSDGKIYAFVRPKPQELAHFEWAVYNADNEFYLPAPGKTNTQHLKGGFVIGYDLYEKTLPQLEYGMNYVFDAFTRYKSASVAPAQPVGQRLRNNVPYVESGLSTGFDVLPTEIKEPVITAIDDIAKDAAGDVTLYYDLLGHPSAIPHQGINIVVTRRGSDARVSKAIHR